MNKEKSLYFNAWEIVKNTDYFLYLFIGGRGIGKSYSIQKGLITDNDRKFIYLRTSENEMEMSLTRESNTFKAINRDCGTNIEITKEKKVYLIEEVEQKDDERNVHMELQVLYQHLQNIVVLILMTTTTFSMMNSYLNRL